MRKWNLQDEVERGELDLSWPWISCGNCHAAFQQLREEWAEDDADEAYDRAATMDQLRQHEAKCTSRRHYRDDPNAKGYAHG